SARAADIFVIPAVATTARNADHVPAIFVNVLNVCFIRFSAKWWWKNGRRERTGPRPRLSTRMMIASVAPGRVGFPRDPPIARRTLKGGLGANPAVRAAVATWRSGSTADI